MHEAIQRQSSSGSIFDDSLHACPHESPHGRQLAGFLQGNVKRCVQVSECVLISDGVVGGRAVIGPDSMCLSALAGDKNQFKVKQSGGG